MLGLFRKQDEHHDGLCDVNSGAIGGNHEGISSCQAPLDSTQLLQYRLYWSAFLKFFPLPRARRDPSLEGRAAGYHWSSVGVGNSLVEEEACQMSGVAKESLGGFMSGVKTLQPGLNEEQSERQQRQREILKRDLEEQVWWALQRSLERV